MKLSHLSLAVFSAIALAACGGSSNDQTTIKKDPPKDPPKEVPAGDKGPVVVSNEANATVVAAGSEQAVKASKQVYFDRSARDNVIGYKENGAKTEFVKGSTKPKDILRASSIVNYVDANWVNDDATLRLNPLQTYAKGADGNYYRIKGPVKGTWSNATADSKFAIVGDFDTKFVSYNSGAAVPASELVYIPNVYRLAGATANTTKTTAYIPAAGNTADVFQLGDKLSNHVNQSDDAGVNFIDPNNIDWTKTPSANNVFDVQENEVDAHTLNFAGKTYAIDSLDNDVEVDFSSIKIAQEIQELPLTVDYTVKDGKGTKTTNDDDKLNKVANVGQARVYNLNYSRALVLMNQESMDKPGAAASGAHNSLGLNDDHDGYEGAFQVVGRETGTLPTNGRAIYTGKSFGVGNTQKDVTTGDVKLEADFGIDRASILGSITNRTAKTTTGEKKLPDWRLQEIMLSQPSAYSVTGSVYFSQNNNAKNGGVYKGGTRVGTWAVQLYGANAENAAGIIFKDTTAGALTSTQPNNPIEVFGSARGDIEPKSLNN